MIYRSLIKLLIAIIYSFFVLVKVTDFFSSFVENKSIAYVKVDRKYNISKAYLLPHKIDNFYLFYEASGGAMCYKETISMKDSFVLFNAITPSLIYFIVDNKNQSIRTFTIKYNTKREFYELEISDTQSSFSYNEYVSYHFIKFIVTMSFLLIIFLCIDYYLNDSFKKYKKLNLAISIALSFIAGGLPYLILLKIYFPVN